MFIQFFTNLIKRIIRVLLSYLSWQSNEIFLTSSIAPFFLQGLFILALCILL